MKKYLLILLSLALMASACTAKSGSQAGSLTGSWKLSSYGSANALTPAVAGTEAGLTFKGDGTLTGNSGCNGLGGDYTVKGDQITFGQIVSTLMACDDPRMAQEQAVQKVLTDTAAFKAAGNTLTLTNHDLVLVFTKQ